MSFDVELAWTLSLPQDLVTMQNANPIVAHDGEHHVRKRSTQPFFFSSKISPKRET
jgi:hypothetical protein